MTELFNHFRNLHVNDTENYGHNELNYSAIFDELDAEISVDEIVCAIKHLKGNERCAEDCILNLFCIPCKLSLLPCLDKLFNDSPPRRGHKVI